MDQNPYSLFSWSQNPFTFGIFPQLFVNHEKELGTLFNALNSGNKFSLLVGPTGSGKTTLLRTLEKRFDATREVLYLAKPPTKPEDWIMVFGRLLQGRFSFFSKGRPVDLYTLADRLNEKLRNRRLLLFVDESHEATRESLEWLRVIADQVNNLYVAMAALPSFEKTLKENLETFLKRVNTRVELGSLNKSETRELIKRRIEWVGGSDIRPFTGEAVDAVYQHSGGFPREVLRLCNDLTGQALERKLTTIDSDFLTHLQPNGRHAQTEERIAPETVEDLPDRQKHLLQALAKKGEATPAQVVALLDPEEYKDRDNAVRSVNNLMKRLMVQGFVERRKAGKAYKYRVTPKYQSVLVAA